MTLTLDDADQDRLGEVISRMQAIQKEIAADKQPPSSFQIDELVRLGQEYAELVELFGTADSGGKR